MSSVLIVHIGAGSHSQSKTEQYRNLLREALRSDSFHKCTQRIERSELTNTGFGSCLNLLGQVECDASFIRAKGGNVDMGSFVGLNSTLYPITETIERMERVWQKYSSYANLGLTKPIALTDSSYQAAANTLNPPHQIIPVDLVSKQAQEFYDLAKERLTETKFHDAVTDTVGVAQIDGGATTVGTSSGGNFFKFPGRIGCAGVIGAAIDFAKVDDIEYSCMCSGNGEDIMAMKLAHHVVTHSYKGEDYGKELMSLIKELSEKHNLLAVNERGEEIVYVGVILVVNNFKTGRKLLVYCHSTNTFYFGYKVHGHPPKVFLSSIDNYGIGDKYAYGECKI